MFPAARLTDPITHDLTVPSGIIGPPIGGPTGNPVLIEGLPAAYMTCTVVCTGVISVGLFHPPPPPTPPLIITKGSSTVMINNMPAARWFPAPGDIGACGAFLGMPPLAATRTVFIGG